MQNLEGLSEEEKQKVLEILNQISKDGKSEVYDQLMNEDWDEVPVDIHTFMHDKRYLGNALYDREGRFTIFPYWEKKLEEIFPDNTSTRYNTIILTGAIGLGKSTIAVICLLYLLYRLLCLKDPYLYYGLQPIDKITVSFVNITLDNAHGVALDKLNQMILSSDWFMSHGKMTGISNLEYIPEKHIELVAASSNNQIIGRALFASFEDEVNFSANTTDVEKMKKKMKTLISQVDARMKSRFMRGTYLPTLNIIASSKNSDQSFLDEYINAKKKNESKTTLIVDEPQWVVDSRKDSKEHFYVAIGNKFLANELLPLNSPSSLIDEYRAKGYNMLEVPIGYYENFQDNIDGALTDIAGIATASSLKYISGIRWNEIKTDTYKNPFTQEIIEVGNGKDDITQYSDFFDLKSVDPKLKTKPLFIHLDMSKTGDKTGIAGVWIVGKRPSIEGEDSSKELYYQVAFSVSIKAPKGREISFDKNRTFIRWLKSQHFNVKGISADTFQSAQIMQQLTADGFNVGTVSVDRLDPATKQCLPYAYLKSSIYERRLKIYKDCSFLTEEVLGLERESDGHINHPENGTQGCFTGDTKVSLVDGRELTMLELVDEFNNGKQNFVYSFNEDKKIIEPKLIEKAWCTRKDAELVEVELDNGEKLRCTPNHKFMLRDGTYAEAKDLVSGDSLMPLYRKYPTEVVSMKDYRMYYEPIEDEWHYEHRRFANEVLDEHYLVHHKNCNPHDNSPTNLVWCSKSTHQKIHAELSTGAHSPEANTKRINSLKDLYKANTEAASEKFKQIFGIAFDDLPSKFKPAYTVKYRRIVGKTILNHKVVSVKKLNYTKDVYDLTIQDNHNFALSAGVFVHNSKDQIDAVCGSLWNASQHADEFAYDYGESVETLADFNTLDSDNEDLAITFEQSLIANKAPKHYFNNNEPQEVPLISEGILYW